MKARKEIIIRPRDNCRNKKNHEIAFHNWMKRGILKNYLDGARESESLESRREISGV